VDDIRQDLAGFELPASNHATEAYIFTIRRLFHPNKLEIGLRSHSLLHINSPYPHRVIMQTAAQIRSATFGTPLIAKKCGKYDEYIKANNESPLSIGSLELEVNKTTTTL